MRKAMLAAALAAMSLTAAAAERFEVPGSAHARSLLAPHIDRIRAKAGIDLAVTPVGTGQAVLDVVDGRAELALVAVPLAEAVAAAREAAWAEGRMLALPPLDARPLEGAEGLSFVSRHGIAARVAKVLPIASRVAEPGR